MESITTEVVDDKQRRDARGRQIVGQERKAELLRAYDGSDLSQREFARREEVNFHTFVEWLQRRRRTAGAKPPPRFQELILPFVPKTCFVRSQHRTHQRPADLRVMSTSTDLPPLLTI